MENFGISDFFGCMIFLPVISYLTFAIFDGIGIFRDVFKIEDKEPEEKEVHLYHHRNQ